MDRLLEFERNTFYLLFALQAFWFYRFLSIVYDHIVNPGWFKQLDNSTASSCEPDARISFPCNSQNCSSILRCAPRAHVQVYLNAMCMRAPGLLHWLAGHWTEDMRTDALVPAKLDSPDLKVGRCS
jgi:hypothetical protein